MPAIRKATLTTDPTVIDSGQGYPWITLENLGDIPVHVWIGDATDVIAPGGRHPYETGGHPVAVATNAGIADVWHDGNGEGDIDPTAPRFHVRDPIRLTAPTEGWLAGARQQGGRLPISKETFHSAQQQIAQDRAVRDRVEREVRAANEANELERNAEGRKRFGDAQFGVFFSGAA